MMDKKVATAAMVIACAAVGGCRMPHFGKAKAPAGQVVATVDGKEITTRDMAVELAGLNTTDPKVRKAAEAQALSVIVTRKLIANAAHEQGLDKTPDFAVKLQRAQDGLLADALAAKLTAAVPAPTAEEAKALVTAHPDMFAERKIFTVDQIRTARPLDAATTKKLEPLDTLEQVQTLLQQNKIDFRRGVTEMDALVMPPQSVDFVSKLPANAIFELPTQQGATINQIKSVKVQPMAGDVAEKTASQMLTNQHDREAVARQLNEIVKKGAASVVYNPAFAPSPKPAAASAAGAPAPAAGAKASTGAGA